VLPRREVGVHAEGMQLHVKVTHRPDGTTTAKTAHDDVAAARGLATRRRLRVAGEAQALDDEAAP